jgi:hypothetical protein
MGGPGPNAVINGLFFDRGTSSTSTSDVLSVSNFPTTTTAGSPQTITVTALASSGSVDADYTGTIHFTSTDPKAVLPANYTFQPGDQGMHTFALGAVLDTAGAQSITATDTATTSITGAETGITVQPAAAVSLAVTGFANPATSGAASNFTVTARDAYGNVATGYAGTVDFTSSDPKAALPPPYQFTAGTGSQTFSATLNTTGTQSITATDSKTSSITGTIIVTVNSAGTSATLLKEDTTTEGNWLGVYGTQGYDLVSGPVSNPSYATPTVMGASTYTWTTTGSASTALETPNSTNRIAAAWYSSTSFTIDINLTNNQAQDIALYALDYDNKGRAEQIQISTTTGTVLSTESLSNFASGAYLQWAITGDVVITVTRTAGANAVINGIFFDSGPSSASASYVKTDSTTEGNWIGSYGSQGYNIVSGPSSDPSYATVTPEAESSYTWSTTLSAEQALEIPNSSNRVAAAWYSSNTFTINVNLTDGNTHAIAIYALDYDNKGRAEQIQIQNASTGAVLATNSISNFAGGVYLQWDVSGDVVITVTRTAGTNAVINGLFIDPDPPAPAAASAIAPAARVLAQGKPIGSANQSLGGARLVAGPMGATRSPRFSRPRSGDRLSVAGASTNSSIAPAAYDTAASVSLGVAPVVSSTPDPSSPDVVRAYDLALPFVADRLRPSRARFGLTDLRPLR